LNYTVSRSYSGTSKHGHFYTKAVNCSTKSCFFKINETEISKNFYITTLRIYNENYIGRMQDWAIINAFWPSNRIDLLGYVHKVLAHIVNIFKKPIGPKESEEECKASNSVGGSTTPIIFI